MAGNKGPVLVIGATGQQGPGDHRTTVESGWEEHAFACGGGVLSSPDTV